MTPLARRFAALSLCLCFFLALTWARPPATVVLADDKPPRTAVAAPPKPQRVYSIGHSFHFFLPDILDEIAQSAGIADHEQVGLSAIGGSSISQHWNVPDDKFKSKATLEAGNLDVLTMAPAFLPDDGIEDFVRLASEKCPRIRILVQESWLPFDAYVDFRKQKVAPPDREVFDAKKLADEYDKAFRDVDAVVRRLNEKYQGQPAVFVAPVGQAVLALRKKIAAGAAPGLTKQSDLFADPIGHAKPPLAVLVAYCYYAQIYGDPTGLPVPPTLKEGVSEEAAGPLNLLLQQIAWDTVESHPLSGVKDRQ